MEQERDIKRFTIDKGVFARLLESEQFLSVETNVIWSILGTDKIEPYHCYSNFVAS